MDHIVSPAPLVKMVAAPGDSAVAGKIKMSSAVELKAQNVETA
ncbi:hypothetical protein PCL1606_58970 [Pseudomonas chlororaphis]|uniref:Uncharacterized protein n=1 Tax=Pseudomonas chlororaphis TaxID=587753 RepID=A0A0D5Y8N6_9PSED|nr:hypothetical protein PCL1606_58970 [Pseudomonas chlororaphis]